MPVSVRAVSSWCVCRSMVETPKPPPPEPTVSEPTTTTARRILVVDDNRDSATSLAMLLKLTGNETHTAYDGLEAVEAAATFRPDVVLLDIGLPKLERLRSVPPHPRTAVGQGHGAGGLDRMGSGGRPAESPERPGSTATWSSRWTWMPSGLLADAGGDGSGGAAGETPKPPAAAAGHRDGTAGQATARPERQRVGLPPEGETAPTQSVQKRKPNAPNEDRSRPHGACRPRDAAPGDRGERRVRSGRKRPRRTPVALTRIANLVARGRSGSGKSTAPTPTPARALPSRRRRPLHRKEACAS